MAFPHSLLDWFQNTNNLYFGAQHVFQSSDSAAMNNMGWPFLNTGERGREQAGSPRVSAGYIFNPKVTIKYRHMAADFIRPRSSTAAS